MLSDFHFFIRTQRIIPFNSWVTGMGAPHILLHLWALWACLPLLTTTLLGTTENCHSCSTVLSQHILHCFHWIEIDVHLQYITGACSETQRLNSLDLRECSKSADKKYPSSTLNWFPLVGNVKFCWFWIRSWIWLTWIRSWFWLTQTGGQEEKCHWFPMTNHLVSESPIPDFHNRFGRRYWYF